MARLRPNPNNAQLFDAIERADVSAFRAALEDRQSLFEGQYSTSPAPLAMLMGWNWRNPSPLVLWDTLLEFLGHNPGVRKATLAWNSNGAPLLHLLASNPVPPRAAHYLDGWLKLGVSLNDRDCLNNPVLTTCHPDWVPVLLSAGADLYTRGHLGRTPLYSSARDTVEGDGRAALRVVEFMSSGWEQKRDPSRQALFSFLKKHPTPPPDPNCSTIYQALRAHVFNERLAARVRKVSRSPSPTRLPRM